MNYWNLIPWSISFLSLILAFIIFLKNSGKDIKSGVEEDSAKFSGITESLLKANLKLDQLCTTTAETRIDVKSMNRQISDLDKRLTIIENDMQCAKNDIETLKKGA